MKYYEWRWTPNPFTSNKPPTPCQGLRVSWGLWSCQPLPTPLPTPTPNPLHSLGPNNASGIIWALGECLFFVLHVVSREYHGFTYPQWVVGRVHGVGVRVRKFIPSPYPYPSTLLCPTFSGQNRWNPGGIQAPGRNLVGIFSWWEPTQIHLDWEWFPPNSHHSHQIHSDPGGLKSSQDPPKFQVESARNPGIPGGIHLDS